MVGGVCRASAEEWPSPCIALQPTTIYEAAPCGQLLDTLKVLIVLGQSGDMFPNVGALGGSDESTCSLLKKFLREK